MDARNLQSGDKKVTRKKKILVDQRAHPGEAEIDNDLVPRECDPFHLLLQENETLATEIQCKKGVITELRRKLSEAEDQAGRAKRECADLCSRSAKEAAAELAKAKRKIRDLRRDLEAKTVENAGLATRAEVLGERVRELRQDQRQLLALRMERADAEMDVLAEDDRLLRLKRKEEEEADLVGRMEKLETKLRGLNQQQQAGNNNTSVSSSSLATNAARKPPSPLSSSSLPGPVHPSVCVSKNLWIKD